MHFYTQAHPGLVQNGNGERLRARSVMDGNDDVIKERTAAFGGAVRIFVGFAPVPSQVGR
jgi:hypothetical protein